MATKSYNLSCEDNVFVDSHGQYNSFNLNQNNHFAFKETLSSKSLTSESKKFQKFDFETNKDLRVKQASWKKPNKHLSTQFLNVDCGSKGEKADFKNAKISENSSTLSLHIAAYENLLEDTSDDSDCDNEKESLKKKSEMSGFVKKWKTPKQLSTASSSSVIQNLFETPRQQKDEPNYPEIMHFKASQKLLKPIKPMANKLKGSKLEAEVDKCRGECNWEKLNQLITSIRTRNSGAEKLIHLVDGELSLEVFLQKHAGSQDRIEPRAQHKDFLRRAEGQLRNAITNNPGEATIVMEAYLLLAKLYYFCASFNEALSSIEKSQMDKATTQFTTLRSLKLAAEGYAVKGLSIEHTLPRDRKENDVLYKRVVSSFEKSAELALSYISELEKSVNSSSSASLISTPNIRIGGLLEIALERVSYLSLRRNNSDRRWDLEGLEWYRKIAIALSDKLVVTKLHQRLCRQLAEVLLRGMIDVGYDSAAINSKSESLKFYTGSRNYFAPASRSEETILLLLISELLASKNIRVSNTFDDEILDRVQLIRNLKKVHNLLSIVLSNLRQYNLLASIYERAMKFANKDRFMWFQFGLSLMSSGRYARSSKILEHCVKLEASDHNNVAEHLMIAKVNLESLGDYDLAMEHASNALSLCHDNWQSSRCTLVYALAFSQKLQTVSSFDTRKVLMVEAIKHFEKAIHLDPHDELAHLYTALQYALCRDLEKAIEHCQRSLEINDEQPSAIMLMALLFTARRDFKSALTLVLNALIDYPNHYGLLVLRLKLEAKYGRLDEVLHTSKNLFSFWRRLPITYNHIITEEENDGQNGTMEKAESAIALKAGSVVQLSSKDALAPVTPMFTAPLGIAAASHVSLTNSNLDIAENGSVLASTAANLSEYGGAASTVSGSLGIMSSGSNVGSIASAFRIQANIWVELAEFFIELDRTTEVQACVEEACNIFPNSHEALYLKSRLFLIRGNKASNAFLSKRYRSEAKSSLLAALSVFPTHLPSLQCLASIYHTEGNLILAEKMLRDMITVDPLHFKQWYELGCILAGQKRYDEAQECFETAGELESSTPIMPFTVIPKLLKNNFA